MSIYTLAFVGIMPLGSILSGVVADQIGTTGSLLVFSSAALLLGVIAPRFGVPHVDDVVAPEFTESEAKASPHQGDVFEGGPVIVLNSWKVSTADLPEFLEVMNELRLVRLTTGAYRWRLLRSTSDPTSITELMALHSWEDHLAQHARIDDAASALIRRARAFDVDGGPRTRHLMSIDVEHPSGFEELVAAHDQMHLTDGSIPPTDQGA